MPFAAFSSPELSQRSQSNAKTCCKQHMTLPITSEYSANRVQMESRSDGCRDHLATSASVLAWRADQSVASGRKKKKERAEAMKLRRWRHREVIRGALTQKEELTEAPPMARTPPTQPCEDTNFAHFNETSSGSWRLEMNGRQHPLSWFTNTVRQTFDYAPKQYATCSRNVSSTLLLWFAS